MLAGYLPFHESNLMEMYRKIAKAEFRCPNWFQPEIRRLLLRILDPCPDTRITIARIRDHPWFKRGMTSKYIDANAKSKNVGSQNTSIVAEDKQEVPRLLNLNAFDLISHYTGFDLSRLFEESCLKKQHRFTSRKPPYVIISKLEDIAKHLKLKLTKRDAGLLRFEGTKEGRKGILSIDAEIFELTPALHLLEVKKSNGDTLEYDKIMNDCIRPGLQDIVWAEQNDITTAKNRTRN